MTRRFATLLIYFWVGLIGQLEAERVPECSIECLFEPTTFVHGCVSATSGSFVYSGSSCLISGPIPLQISHHYNKGIRSDHWKAYHFSIGPSTHQNIYRLDSEKRGKRAYFRGDLIFEGGGYASFTSPKRSGELRLDPSIYKEGITNVFGDRISGQTNIDNVYIKVHQHERYFATKTSVIQGDGKESFYENNVLKNVRFPSGNELRYHYDDGWLVKITSHDREGRQLAPEIQMRRDHGSEKWGRYFIKASNGVETCHTRSRALKNQWCVSATESNQQPHCQYSYEAAWYHVPGLEHEQWTGDMTRLTYGGICALKVTYDDARKVSSLKAPYGSLDIFKDLYTFEYADCRTSVKNGLGDQTIYKFDVCRRLGAKEFYQKKDLYCSQQFFWNHRGWLIAKALVDRQGKTYILQQYRYDNRGNVLEERTYGDLTGRHVQTFSTDLRGNPTAKVECTAIYRSYSDDGYNLLLSESDGECTTKYSYDPETKLLQEKIIEVGGEIYERCTYAYNNAAILIEEVVDDLQGHINYSEIEPEMGSYGFGLPKVITSGYIQEGSRVSLQKVEKIYGKFDLLLSERVYDGKGILQVESSFCYDEHGNKVSEIDAVGRKTSYAYDARFNKIYECQEDSGCEHFYDYNLRNLLVTERFSYNDGVVLEKKYEYDLMNRKIQETDVQARISSFSYDALDRLIKVVEPPLFDAQGVAISREWCYAYNIAGQLIKTTDPKGATVDVVRNIRGDPTKIVYPDSSYETFIYDLRGLLIEKRDRLGLVTRYTYDALKRLVEEDDGFGKTCYEYSHRHLIATIDAKGTRTEYHYDAAGRKVAEITQNRKTSYEYDGLNRPYKVIRSIDEGRYVATQEKRDPLDRLLEKAVFDQEGRLFAKESYTYDLNDNVVLHETWVDDHTTRREQTRYNSRGEIIASISPDGFESSYAYDYDYPHHGQRLTKKISTDPLGRKTLEVTNVQGKIILKEIQSPSGESLLRETSVYDALGNKTGQKLADYYIEWEYGPLGEKTAIIEHHGLKTTRFIYKEGKLATIIKPSGQQIFHTYDTRGRLTTLKSSDLSVDCAYVYDACDNLRESRNLQITVIYAYNIWHEKISETVNGHCITSDYDRLGRVSHIGLNDSSIEYDYEGPYLRTITRGDYVHTYFDINGDGKPRKSSLMGQAGVLSSTWDICGRPQEISHSAWHQKVNYNPLGNIIQITDNESTNRYSYDDLYQLKTEEGFFTHHYLHDSLNNRLRKDTENYAVNSLNQVVSLGAESLTYDVDGNLLTWNGHNLRFDALDRLISFDDVTYSYDAEGRRIFKKEASGEVTQFFYQGLAEIGSLREGKLQELRVLGYGKGGDTGAAVLMELEGQIFIPLHDIHGHVAALLNLQGSLIQKYHYDAFGNMAEDKAVTPWRAFSKRLDPESHFLCFNKRYYIAPLGRFLTPDPLYFADGPNLYAYVHNNPLSLFDPFGLLSLREGWDFTKGFGNGVWDRVKDTASGAASLLKTSSDYSAPQLLSDYYRDRSAYDTKIHSAQELIQGLGLYLQESSRDFNSVKAALTDLFVPGCREVNNLSNEGSYYDKGRAWGHATTDIFLTVCGVKAIQGISKIKQAVCFNSAVGEASSHAVLTSTPRLGQYGLPKPETILTSAQRFDRNGLTMAGRSLDKHGNRPNSPFPKAKGNEIAKNAQGLEQLKEILKHAENNVIIKSDNDIRIYITDGRGLKIRSDGSFVGFLNYE